MKRLQLSTYPSTSDFDFHQHRYYNNNTNNNYQSLYQQQQQQVPIQQQDSGKMPRKKSGQKNENQVIVEAFECCGNLTSMQQQWWSDAYIMDMLTRHGGTVTSVLKKDRTAALKQFNTAITRWPAFSLIDAMFPQNSTKFHRMKWTLDENKKNRVYFYYFSGDPSIAPDPELTIDIAKDAFKKKYQEYQNGSGSGNGVNMMMILPEQTRMRIN